MLDTAIIGGGASGLAAAIMLKQNNKQLNIAVFEQLDRVGKKISVTGNGRCNIANKNAKSSNFHGKSLQKAEEILSNFPLSQVEEFFSSIGIEFAYEKSKAYPRSFQASSVVDALRFAAENLGVEIFTSSKITDLRGSKDNYNLFTDNKEIPHFKLKARSVLIATGGLAGGSKLGSNGDGYAMLKKIGHKILPQSPVIVQVKTENSVTKSLKGIKIDAKVTVTNKNKTFSDFGEVLFCDYGLSGPPILQLSRYCENGAIIHLDMFDEMDVNALTSLLIKRICIFKNQPLTEFFAGLLHKRLGQAVLKSLDFQISAPCNTVTEFGCKQIAKTLKDFKFKALGNTGFVNAQATAGGADLADFDNNLMSKKMAGIFAAGEVLDVDGDCGGFNLLWAWSSAYTAHKAIIKYLAR